jgi:hypothetical protein
MALPRHPVTADKIHQLGIAIRGVGVHGFLQRTGGASRGPNQ